MEEKNPFEPIMLTINNFVSLAIEVFAPIVEQINKAFSAFYKAIGWQQLPYESDDDWAKRLARDGWLDNPDARWEYQKIIWSTPIRLIRKAYRRRGNHYE